MANSFVEFTAGQVRLFERLKSDPRRFFVLETEKVQYGRLLAYYLVERDGRAGFRRVEPLNTEDVMVLFENGLIVLLAEIGNWREVKDNIAGTIYGLTNRAMIIQEVKA